MLALFRLRSGWGPVWLEKNPGDSKVPRDCYAGFSLPPLEIQFQRKLAETRIRGARHCAKGSGGGRSGGGRHLVTVVEEGTDPARRQKLRVIKDIEEFRPELESHSLGDRCVLN